LTAPSVWSSRLPQQAQLVVLPELFHLGYAYSDSVHARAEALDGPTLTMDALERIAAAAGCSLRVKERVSCQPQHNHCAS
jgi:predicted amidohydrolase